MLRFLATLISIAALAAVGCGEIEPEPPVDDEGEPIPVPDPGEQWLYFTEVQPKDQLPLDPTIEITFNEYLDPGTFTSYGTARLISGGIRAFGRVDYRMTRKTLVFEPYGPLEPELVYSLRWTASQARSVTGSPLHPLAILPDFTATADAEPSPEQQRPVVEWEEVEEIFGEHCGGCHADESRQLPPLEHDELVGGRSRQVDRMLVEPFHPARSYLMHKILPDYPVRRFTEQPPPYSDQPALETKDIERIEHWIAAGAPR